MEGPGLRLGGAIAAAAALVLAAGGARADVTHDPTYYCPGTSTDAIGAATTDAEHTILVGDEPFPPGVRAGFVTVNGVRTRVAQAGVPDAEEAVVFVHGNPGSSRDFDRLLVAAAGVGTRAVSFDMPGLGHADDRPGGPYSTDGAARFIGSMLDRLGIRRAHLVLHDFGGPWGLQWATTHLDRLASATLIDTGVFIGYYGHPSALVWHEPVTGEAYMASTTRQSFDEFLQANNPRPLPQRFVDRMYDDFDRPTRCAALGYYRSVDNPDAMGRAQAAALRKRPRPALVIWGKQDAYIPSSLAETQKQAFPGAEIHVLDGDGHWPFVDEPDRVRDLMVPFLRRVIRTPRLVVVAGRLRPGARKLRLIARAEGVPAAGGVRFELVRGGRVAASRSGLFLSNRPRRVVVRLRHAIRRGAYTLTVRSAYLPAQMLALRAGGR